MKDTAERQLRAYVCLHSGSITWDGLYSVVGHATFKNSGQTPGFGFSTWSKVTIADLDATPFVETPTPDERAVEGRSIIAPQGDAHINRPMRPVPVLDDFTAVEGGTKAIFFWGRVDYVDAFRAPRHFIFRCRVTGRPQQRVQSGQEIHMGWALAPHTAGYEAN